MDHICDDQSWWQQQDNEAEQYDNALQSVTYYASMTREVMSEFEWRVDAKHNGWDFEEAVACGYLRLLYREILTGSGLTITVP